MVKVSAITSETNLDKFPLSGTLLLILKSFSSRYNVPRSFLESTGNLLVLLEEEYGDPLRITLDSVSITNVCGHVSESHLPPVAQSQSRVNYNKDNTGRPKVLLHCPSRRNISRIVFASFGTPSGDCENYATGNCHLSSSRAIVEKVSFLLIK